MDVSKLLTREPPASASGQADGSLLRQGHSYPTRQTCSSNGVAQYGTNGAEAVLRSSYPTQSDVAPPYSRSALKQPPKTVNFQLLLSNIPHHRARLPLRVHINPHDTTDSIITTVKNFYGLYEGEGVSFEDSTGTTLIAQYENLRHDTTIHVRVISEQQDAIDMHSRRVDSNMSPPKPRLDEAFQMPPPQPYARPQSRVAKKRSMSPLSGSGRRSVSARAPSKGKGRNGGYEDNDVVNGLSDSDAGSVSVSSSRRAKLDHLASAEISLDNIVEGGRRKRAKFESSELPLFAPSQQPMTASMSSVSPQRRLTNPNMRSPLPYNNQYNFAYNYSLPSPQSYGYADNTNMSNGSGGAEQAQGSARPQDHRLRGRALSGHGPSRLSGGSMSGILPTPDPTIGSVISDEDVALQLMRLGDASNISNGRTSTSTMDDALSGKAELASSEEETDDDSTDEEERLPPSYQDHAHGRSKPSHVSGPARKKPRVDAAPLGVSSGETSGEDYDDNEDGSFKGESDGLGPDAFMLDAGHASHKTKSVKSQASSTTSKAQSKSSSLNKSKSKSLSSAKIPPSPYGQPPAIRKASSGSTINFQQQLLDNDDDLSSKPRCQRCRKSKKGCDRQRPCQRCKDAGIGHDGCVSEDEGNGRKGRYGRHMGVSLSKDSSEVVQTVEESSVTPTNGYAPTALGADANKKRKR